MALTMIEVRKAVEACLAPLGGLESVVSGGDRAGEAKLVVRQVA